MIKKGKMSSALYFCMIYSTLCKKIYYIVHNNLIKMKANIFINI